MTMSISGQQKERDRDPVVAGSFYPARKSELNKLLDQLFSEASELKSISINPEERVRAIIAPHAGYVFSGTVAASAVECIPPAAKYDNIFLIGSSHRVSFPGASIYAEGDYRTPLGTAEVNTDLAEKLIDNSKVFSYYKAAHSSEHSLEVQIPFLQYHLGTDIRIIPIVLGTQNSKVCKDIADALRTYFNGNNLFVISSDFSHYPSFEDAIKVDRSTVEGLLSGNPDTFLRTIRKNSEMNIEGLATSMCGWTSGLVLLHLAEEEAGLEFKHILYRNSGHSDYGDKSSVVGYHSVALIDKNNTGTNKKEFSITHTDKQKLIEIARGSIISFLEKGPPPLIDETKLSLVLKEKLGAFVSLHLDGNLRGCIGRFMPSEPLCETVKAIAVEAAFYDTRFKPLSREEFEKITIEISVLSPLRKIDNIDEILLGKHGVYIKKGIKSGTFLPQVAENRKWTITDFLGHLSRDKAGLGWTGWADADIYVYEALVFEEE
ncbi:MAG: AmmeMemoRadiSam system protein B [Bacteroidota bacterium]|nr:AmmeMemoRadiSam system protein B [Bacteroidota bacterium]